MARVLRDDHGVPHVRAGDLLDLAHGQGEATAADRTWQLEWLRRRATGTTAALLGPSGTAWDVLARRVRLARTARLAHDRLDDESRAFVAAYAAGVTAGLRDDAPELVHLGARPQPWEPWTPVAVLLAHHLLFGCLGEELWARRVAPVLGDDADLLARDRPVASGSNAWAVGGARTASGRPLVAGDPHRNLDDPGAYVQVGLACDGPDDRFDVAGFALVGVPGVQHFAHAGDVAWAITNAMADNQDLVDVVLDDATVLEAHVEQVAVAGGDPVDVEVLVTALGPVVDGERGGPGLVVRHALEVHGRCGLDAVPGLLRARTVTDVDRALDRWVEPVNNVVTADVHGRVLYRVAGRVPTRAADGTWTGWLDPLPRTEVAPDGHVVTANEHRGPESDDVGSGFAPPWRARRIDALLAGRDDLTVEDCVAVHDDCLLEAARPLLDLLHRAVDGEPLAGWDLRMEAGSTDAGRFAQWRSALARRVAAAPVLAPLLKPWDEPVGRGWLARLLAPSLDVTARVGLALPHLVTADHPLGLDLVAAAAAAWAEVADLPLSTWGELHVLAPAHPLAAVPGTPSGLLAVPAVGVSGDAECVRCTGSVPGVSDTCARGSVARYAWDLAGLEHSGWVVPTGSSGVPGSPHHLDQLPLWVAGRLAPVR